MLIEQRLGAPTCDDAVGDGISVALIDIAGLADATLEVNTRALLDDVCGLVCRGVKTRRACERDVVAGCERFGAHCFAGISRVLIEVGLHAGDVVEAEQMLDDVDVRQR
jgi:hypothetical protein